MGEGRLRPPLSLWRQNPRDGRLEATGVRGRDGRARSPRPRRSERRTTSAPASDALELGEGLEGDPAVAFRRTLGMFATGVTVLTTRVGEQVHGMTANAFMSVSLRPPLVLISIDRRAKMGALLHEGTRFGVSVLEARQTGLSDRFAGRVARRACRRRRSSSSTRRRSSRARSRTSSRASCARTGAATTRCSSARSSSRATARAGRCSSTVGRYERLDRGSARLLAPPTRAPRPDPRARRGARVRGRRADHADRRGRVRAPARGRRRGAGRATGPLARRSVRAS